MKIGKIEIRFVIKNKYKDHAEWKDDVEDIYLKLFGILMLTFGIFIGTLI